MRDYSHGPPKQCCLFDCAFIGSIFKSIPRGVTQKSPAHMCIEEPLGGNGSSARPYLNESLLSEETNGTPISRTLLSTVRDVAILNKELVRALDDSDAEIVKAALGQGANPNHQPVGRKDTPLMIACFNSDRESVFHLLHAQADPNSSGGHENKITPLMIAAENGMTEAVSELLRFGADPHLRNQNGETALLAAARTNNHDAFAALVGSMVSN
jgi:hypothetical protein